MRGRGPRRRGRAHRERPRHLRHRAATGEEGLSNTLRIAVDIGGTFTDGVAVLSPAGRIWVGKTPTTPEDPGEAVSTVIRDLLRQVGATAPAVAEVVHGTTLITNTLIERKGSRTALVTTSGHRDMLDIGREWRYDIYDLDIVLPRPLIASGDRVTVEERLDARGEVLEKLSEAELTRVSNELKALRVESVAVSLLHAYVNDVHERALRERLSDALPGVAVSLSSEVAREIKEFERTSTTAANAYVKPIVAAYLHELEARIARIQAGVPLRIMVSSGGFTSAKSAAHTPILLLESGPAAGVLSALNTAYQHEVQHVLAFDMGGTTAKACAAVGGEPPVAHAFECARVERFKRGSGLPILIPSIDLIEIGAGGGSIAFCNALGLLNVGPQSSGSVPGPACYGRGGTEPTVTDADLLLGYLSAENFLGGEMKLRTELSRNSLSGLAKKLNVSTEEAAWGIYDMVNENMASAARIHIAENGHDPREFTMVATGGAGPVHAVEVARKLRIPRVMVPIAAGAGSCLGMLAAPARVDRAWSDPRLVADIDWKVISRKTEELRRDAQTELASAGAGEVDWTLGADMRYFGQGAEVRVAFPYGRIEAEELVRLFEESYRKLYGRTVPGARPQVITWRLTGRAQGRGHRFAWGVKKANVRSSRREIYLPLRKTYAEVAVHDRYSVPAGTVLEGPLVLEERECTLVAAVKSKVTILPDLTASIAIEEFD
ncbi:MAG TPA: hydantoinase/oxoprolinase family protein [Burkholderiales bacterium]|nr:hydantoinase/oxoprolinase family protein [Burkholderiales bacterium]